MGFNSCTEDFIDSGIESFNPYNTNTLLPVYSDSIKGLAQANFASCLSKAVYNNEEFRNLIKDEALKMFDNDYEILWLDFKNIVLSSGKTVRESLFEYLSEKDLLEIENVLPLLTVLVPDLTFIGSFNARSWDVSNPEVCVCYSLDGGSGIVYGNGEIVTTLERNEIPDFPILVVKDNERIVLSSTRSGELKYTFIDKAFDGTCQINTRGSGDDYDRDFEVEDYSSMMTEEQINSINPFIIPSYNDYISEGSGCQRDFLYYGMSSSNPDFGSYRNIATETMYKFKVFPSQYNHILDQDEDLRYQQAEHEVTELSKDEIISKIWKDGSFEFLFKIITSFKDGNQIMGTSNTSGVVSVAPRNLFDLQKVHVHRRHKTMFRHTNYTYIVDVACLTPKWVDCKINYSTSYINIFSWNLAYRPVTYSLSLEERDSNYTEIIEQTFNSGMSTSITTDLNTGSSNKITYGIQNTTSFSCSVSVSKTYANDDLGSVTFSFQDDIIKSGPTIKNINGVVHNTYEVFAVNNGCFEIMVLPFSTSLAQ